METTCYNFVEWKVKYKNYLQIEKSFSFEIPRITDESHIKSIRNLH